MGSHRFNDIERGLPRISRSLLIQRLQGLVRSGIVERQVGQTPRSTSYHLSPAGTDLTPVVVALGEWGARWAFGAPNDDELDPVLLWSMRGRVEPVAIPEGRTVIRFDLTAPITRHFWLVLEPGDASVCLQDPGFEVDLLVTAELSALYEVWYGRLDLGRARRDARVCLQGPRPLQRSFPDWFTLSPLAGAVRAAHTPKVSAG